MEIDHHGGEKILVLIHEVHDERISEVREFSLKYL